MKRLLLLLLLVPTVAGVNVDITQPTAGVDADIRLPATNPGAAQAQVCAGDTCLAKGLSEPEPDEAPASRLSTHGDAPVRVGKTHTDEATAAWGLAVPALGLMALLAKLYWAGPGRIAKFILGPGRFLGIGLLASWTWPTDLENKTRTQLSDYVKAHPGASIQEARQHAGIAWGTAVYHLQRLERDGTLVSLRSGNHHRYWCSGTQEARVRHGWAVLEQPTTAKIADVVFSSPGIHQADLCQRVRIKASTASKHLKRLVTSGLVMTKRCSRFVMYAPTEELQQIISLRHGQAVPA